MKVCPVVLLQLSVTGVAGVSFAPAGAVHAVLALGNCTPAGSVVPGAGTQPACAKCCATVPCGENIRIGPLSLASVALWRLSVRSSITPPARSIDPVNAGAATGTRFSAERSCFSSLFSMPASCALTSPPSRVGFSVVGSAGAGP